MTWTAENIESLNIPGLEVSVLGEIRSLLRVWSARRSKNLKRSLYYDTEQTFEDLGIAMPPQLRSCNYVLGWSTQAVKKPAMRSQFDGLRLPGSDDPFELGELLDENNFALELSQAVVSAYKHGMSLITVARGAPGEVPVQIIGHSAESCAARWDTRSRRLSSALTIADTDDSGKPVEFVVYLPFSVVTCWFTRGSGWKSHVQPNRTGRVLAVPVLSDPQLTKPLGRSRLTNAVMRLNDMAVRTLGRMEGNAEFYSSPQIALLGVDYEAFYGDNPMSDNEKFKLAMDRLLAISKDEDGDKPDLKQLQQATMTPHSDMMRTIAMAFSGETSLPPSSLGVIQDQPSSAEAIRAAEHDMLIDVTYHNKFVHSKTVKQVSELAVMIRDNLTVLPDGMWRLSVAFDDPEFRSLSSQSDAVMKLATQMESLTQHPVLMERVFTQDEIERILDDSRRSAGRSALTALVEQNAQRARGVADAVTG